MKFGELAVRRQVDTCRVTSLPTCTVLDWTFVLVKMPNVIQVSNAVITAILAWVTLNHLGIVEYNLVDKAVEEFQRLVHYSELDGSVMAPPETLMTVVS